MRALTIAALASVAFVTTAEARMVVRVQGDLANVRHAPAASARIVARLHEGDELRVLDERGMWYRVQAGGTTGWVIRTQVEFVIMPDAPAKRPHHRRAKAPEPEPEPEPDAWAGQSELDRGEQEVDDETDPEDEENPLRVAERAHPARRSSPATAIDLRIALGFEADAAAVGDAGLAVDASAGVRQPFGANEIALVLSATTGHLATDAVTELGQRADLRAVAGTWATPALVARARAGYHVATAGAGPTGGFEVEAAPPGSFLTGRISFDATRREGAALPRTVILVLSGTLTAHVTRRIEAWATWSLDYEGTRRAPARDILGMGLALRF